MNTTEVQALVLGCDAQGRVRAICEDGLGLTPCASIGEPVFALADAANQEKARSFLDAVQSAGVAFDWEINVPGDGTLVPLHWAGSRGEQALVVLLARTRGGLLYSTERGSAHAPELADAFRALRAEGARLAEEHSRRDARLLDELTRLNNELAALQRELARRNAELERLDQLKNRFLGMAAHDLRKPTGVIVTYTEFVLDEAGPTLAAEHRRFLQTCLHAATGMKRLVDDFLDVAVIESGKLRLDLSPTTAAEIVAGAAEIVRLVAAKKKVQFTAEPADAGRRLTADAAKLQQVLMNLVGNAVEHSRPGQRVWLDSRWAARELVLAVRDQGPGLTPEDQARLFVPFAKAGTRKTSGERSVGLGLQIARLIVEAHQGRIWVESTPGAGATFLVAVPAGVTSGFPREIRHEPSHSYPGGRR